MALLSTGGSQVLVVLTESNYIALNKLSTADRFITNQLLKLFFPSHEAPHDVLID